jgi:hypothetical protein
MRIQTLGVLTAGCTAAIAGSASADFVNGNFELGNTPAGHASFTTQYNNHSVANGGLTFGAQAYGIMTNSQAWHSSFASFGDHTTGSGYMMIFNGATAANQTLWQQDVTVSTGNTYRLEFYARSAYPDSPATISITATVNALSTTFNLPANTNGWVHFSMDFTANVDPTTIRLVDTNLAAGGNDFAIDDISLTAVVPLPSAAWAGLSTVACVAGVGIIRRRRLLAN